MWKCWDRFLKILKPVAIVAGIAALIFLLSVVIYVSYEEDVNTSKRFVNICRILFLLFG